jgi:hypothetical protein
MMKTGKLHPLTRRAATLLGMVLVVSIAFSSYAGGQTELQAKTRIPACANGTVASYLGTTCSQAPATMQWTSYSCVSIPSSICDALGPKGSNIHMRMDPNGHHTILVSSSGLWNVTAGQRVQVIIKGLVYGATTNNNWPHFGNLPGQTGDGMEDNKTTVFCRTNCLTLQGVSDVPCSNTSPNPYCIDQNYIEPYLPLTAKFHAATADNPYNFSIIIRLDGGITGTATLKSVGVHLS